MKAKYHEMMEELKFITSHEGFIDVCLDLRDSMYFYDKGLVLAGYASSVEMLMSLAMFWATLEGPQAQQAVFDQIASILGGLDDRLRSDGVSMDITSLTETFLQTSGWVLEQRHIVFREMFYAYGDNDYDLHEHPDKLLRQIQSVLETDTDYAAKLMGKVGAMALRGVEIRPVWFLIARPRMQMWLRGILGAIQNFASAAHFSFPVDTVEKEKQKWGIKARKLVVDLKTFRNLRYPMLPADPPDILARGQHDSDLLELFDDRPLGSETALRLAGSENVNHHVLMAILESEELCEKDAPGDGWAPVNVMAVLEKQGDSGTIPTLLRLLGRLRPDKLLYRRVMAALIQQANEAAEAALNRLREPHLSVGEALALVALLEQVQPAKVYPALANLLDKAASFEDKLAVAQGLLETGDSRAIPHLRRLGASMSGFPYGAVAKEFLDMASLKMRAEQSKKRRI